MSKFFLILFFVFTVTILRAQNVNIEELKDFFKAKPVVFTGGVSANSLFYQGKGSSGREPFSYFLQGNVNANLFGKINLPFSFNFTNAGVAYQYPTLPSRLSLHPTYKWVSGHVGDVAMSFSPYTLNGHQFRGVGVDLSPPNTSVKVSAMYGRLQKATVPGSVASGIMPAYERRGAGLKVVYEQAKYAIGISAFYAKDKETSLLHSLDSFNIRPQQNIAFSYLLSLKPVKGLELNVEYGNSILKQDLRDTAFFARRNTKSVYKNIFPFNNATTVFNAVKAQMNYAFAQSVIGINYERVDPGYRTLGAYFFNNDIEMMGVNLAQSLWKGKANVNLNVGVQRDNLDHAKTAVNKRVAANINMNINPSEKVQSSLSYSNFQTYMNILPQFQFINQYTPYQNFDTLNYMQVSQNAGININFVTKKDDNQLHNFNTNFTFQDAIDQQGGIVRKGAASQFYNLATTYAVTLPKKGVGISVAFNASYNTIGRNDFFTLGPTVSFTARLLENKLSSGLSLSYNSSLQNKEMLNTILNARANAAYNIYKKHNLTFSLINQNRKLKNKPSNYDITGTLGYSYNF